MKTTIIAEVGANHNRNFDQALALINVAKDSGADIVKFQTYSSENLYSKNTPDFANYKNINQLIKNIELPREWQKDLKLYCDENNIEFMSTPFDEKAVQELVDINVKRLKISGFESTDFRFVEMVASSKLPLIISIGIGFQKYYFEKIIKIKEKYNNEIVLLHCNNAYPTPIEDINLGAIKKMSENKNFITGISDHTISTIVPALAVIAGARFVEKHITLSNLLPGPDHTFALEPNKFKIMCENIREAELANNFKKNQFTESEKKFIKATRSVVAKTKINIGDIFTTNNITTKRPFLDNCIPASEFENILGKKSLKNYEEDSFI